MSETLRSAVEEYENYSRARGLKENSLRVAHQTLVQFIETTGNVYMEKITPTHIERFFTAHPTWKASTRNTRLTQLSQFFKWADNRGYTTEDIMYGWRAVKVPDVDRLRVPVQEWSRLFDNCLTPVQTAAVAIGLYMFTRVSETADLRVGDINWHSHTITLRRKKTDTIDEMPMSLELETILREYVQWYTDHLMARGIRMDENFYLIPPVDTTHPSYLSGTGEPLKPACKHTVIGPMIAGVLRRSGYEKGEDEGWGGHVLRRSGARALFDARVTEGYDGALKLVQAMLGHKSATMTESYLGLTLDKEKRNVELSGRPMFPALMSRTVTNLREVTRLRA